MAEIAKFWVGRVHFNQRTQKYMIFGVTGLNEYENNVNNNWYTNRMAAWCLEYFVETCAKLDDDRLEVLQITPDDLKHMQDIADRMYYPDDRGLGIFRSMTPFWTRICAPHPTYRRRSALSICTGRGIASCVRGTSSSRMC